MTNNPDVVEVIAEDREFASRLIEYLQLPGWRNSVANIPKGNADLGWIVQHFARHRLAAEQRLRERVERFRILLSKDSPTRCDYDSDRSFLDAHRNWENRVRQALADYRKFTEGPSSAAKGE